jgi:hypothetical protein
LDEKRFDPGSLAEIFAPDAKVTRPNGATTVGPRSVAESHEHNLGRFRATRTPDQRRHWQPLAVCSRQHFRQIAFT